MQVFGYLITVDLGKVEEAGVKVEIPFHFDEGGWSGTRNEAYIENLGKNQIKVVVRGDITFE